LITWIDNLSIHVQRTETQRTLFLLPQDYSPTRATAFKRFHENTFIDLIQKKLLFCPAYQNQSYKGFELMLATKTSL